MRPRKTTLSPGEFGHTIEAVAGTHRRLVSGTSPAIRKRGSSMSKHRIYSMSVANVYPHYVTKAEKKGRTKEEVDEIIRWVTGYTQDELEEHLEIGTDFETFFAQSPQLNPARRTIKGVICGVRVEEIEEPLMQEIR